MVNPDVEYRILFVFFFIFNWFNCNCNRICLKFLLVIWYIVKMLCYWSYIVEIFLYQFISTGLVNFNTGDFCKWMLLYLFQFSFLHLPIWQRLLWKLDLDSCFRFSDWSFILLSGNFIQILTLTVVCFVSHHVLLSQQIKIGFKL